LEPDEDTLVVLELTNDGDEPVTVQSVRLSGDVLGMTFFDYTTRVERRIAAGGSEPVQFAFDLRELGGQATGRIPATLSLLDTERQPLLTQDLPVEVQGSLRSVYGIFGLAVCASAVLLSAILVVQLATGRLPHNRWNRAVRFAVPGLAVGLTLTVTLSVLELVTPSATAWVTLVVASAGVAFLVGYLSPTPVPADAEEDDEAEEEGSDLVAAQPAAGPRVVAQRRPGGAPVAPSSPDRAPSGEEPSRAGERPGGRPRPPTGP
jgi:hypothetical protein